jgi:uncharacterized protein (DUF58 family)
LRLKTPPAAALKPLTTTRPASVFLNQFALLAALILLLWAAWAGLTAMVILLGLGLAAAGLSWLWSYLALRSLHCERSLSETRFFPGENLEIRLRLVNRKLLPLAWVQVSDEAPSGFILDAPAEPATRPGYGLVTRSAAVLGYSARHWSYQLHCNRRGYYPLGPLTVTSGDIFGFYPRQATQTDQACIIVYPRVYSLPPPAIHSLYPMGEVKIVQPIFEDPSRTIGIRSYVPGDSLRRIHWKASLRQRELQVKIFEPSTTLRAAIFLAVDSFPDENQANRDALELGISAAASLANSLLEKKNQVGLYANSNLADSGQPAPIHCGAGSDHLLLILEGLAKVTRAASQPFFDFFQEQRRELSRGATLIFFFSRLPEALGSLSQELREKGYRIAVFQPAGSANDVRVPEIAYYSFSPSPENNALDLQAL